MGEAYVTFGGVFVLEQNGPAPAPISISRPKLSEHGDYKCTVSMPNIERRDVEVFGLDSGNCLKNALIYIEDFIFNCEAYSDGKIVDESGTRNLPIIRVRR